MEQYEKDMQLIALLSGEIGEEYTYIESEEERVEHFCKELNQQILFHLCEVEFFKEGKVKTAKANFCEHCKQVFIYKPNK
jgi:hypothetical protein